MNIIYIAIAFLAGVSVAWFFVRKIKGGRKKDKETDYVGNDGKILALIEKRGRVTNDEVQNLLDISDSTATRYMNSLEKRGLVRQKGVGRGIYYEKTS